MPTKSVPYTDAAGRRRWVEVSAETALTLDSFDRNMRRRDALFRAHHRQKAGANGGGSEPTRRGVRRNGRRVPKLVGFLNIELEPAFREVARPNLGSPWEGPRMKFSHLLGEGRTWSGPDALWRPTGDGHYVCATCGGLKLGSHQYCLGCDRHGRETTT